MADGNSVDVVVVVVVGSGRSGGKHKCTCEAGQDLSDIQTNGMSGGENKMAHKYVIEKLEKRRNGLKIGRY